VSKKAGIWIDHHRAVIVILDPAGEHTSVIDSDAHKHLERSGDSPLKGSYEAAQVPPMTSGNERLLASSIAITMLLLAPYTIAPLFTCAGPVRPKANCIGGSRNIGLASGSPQSKPPTSLPIHRLPPKHGNSSPARGMPRGTEWSP